MNDYRRISLLEGDPEAIAAIRNETRRVYRATDIDDEAPVFFWNGLFVRGTGDREYQVPSSIQEKYLQPAIFPQSPIACMSGEEPTATTAPLPQDAQEDRGISLGGMPAEGDDEVLAFVREVTRLYHEVASSNFPTTGEVRWFQEGLHVVGEDNRLFQVPMDRIHDIVVPREYPLLPVLHMTAAARRSLLS